MFLKDKRDENVAQNLITLAADQAMFGKCQEAKQNVKGALAHSRGRVVLSFSALALAVCNDVGQAQSILDESIKTYPLDFLTTTMSAPLIRAAIERSRGNSQQALEHLESIRTYDMSFVLGTASNYVRGHL